MWAHPKGVETTGALDLGGASTQISFAVGEAVELNTSDVMKVSLYGYVYTLYTRSFQCYGRNEAEKRFLATLLQVAEWGGLGAAVFPRGSQRSGGGGVPCLPGSALSAPVRRWMQTTAFSSFPVGVRARALSVLYLNQKSREIQSSRCFINDSGPSFPLWTQAVLNQ